MRARDWTMELRGFIAAWLLGIIISWDWNPKHWSGPAWLAALCFFVGWIVASDKRR